MADSCYMNIWHEYMAETSAMLESDYPPIKNKYIKRMYSFEENLPAYMGFPAGSDGKKKICVQCSREDPLDKGMATHSSILAWRIPRTEEPDGLQSMGSQRVRHD